MKSILAHCAEARSERLEPGTVLLAEGQRTDRLYVLIEGQFDVSRGDVYIASIKEPGSIFGEMSLFMDGSPAVVAHAARQLDAQRVCGGKALNRVITFVTQHGKNRRL